MQNRWKCVICFAAILSIINVVHCFLITIHVDSEGKVTDTAPTSRTRFPKDWNIVVSKDIFDGITNAGFLGSIQTWLKIQGVEFKPLSESQLKESVESAELDIWANDICHVEQISKDRTEYQKFVSYKKGAIDNFKKAVESHVANLLVAQVLGEKSPLPKKMHFEVAYQYYASKFDEGLNFRIILKKVEEKSENTAQNGNVTQNGIHNAAQNSPAQRNSGHGNHQHIKQK